MYLKSSFATLLLLLGCGGAAFSQIESALVPLGSTWQYLDNGSNQGTGWSEFGYDDSGWASGAAPLGYGDPWILTPVSFGPNSSSKFVTTYFRKTFDIADPSTMSNPRIRFQRDDGIVVYLNETEIYRNNMPFGTIGFTTFASSSISGGGETVILESSIASGLLLPGPNLLAVEVHQVNADSTDLTIDLGLFVDLPSGVPQILAQPQTQSVIIGSTVTFSVDVFGDAPLTLQWSKDGVPLTNGGDISGADTVNLTIANVDDTDEGRYRVLASNPLGSALSAEATLTVRVPSAGNVFINFDENEAVCFFAGTVRLTTAYQDLGVTFSGPGGLDGGAILNQCGGFGVSGHSLPNFLAFNSSVSLGDGGFARGPETMIFDPPAREVDMLLGSGLSGLVTVTAYDASGAQVDSASLTMTSTLAPVQLRADAIVRVVVDAQPSYWVLDDLRFSSSPIQNGSFETGNFAGWTVSDLAAPYSALQVLSAGSTWGLGAFTATPTDGNFVATHGFDGQGPGVIRIAQDILVPDRFTLLSFHFRAGWNMQGYGATQPRRFELTIEPPGGGTPLLASNLLTALPETVLNDTGPQHRQVSLSAFVGQTVRISFDAYIPEAFTGPGMLQLDHVELLLGRPEGPPVILTQPQSQSVLAGTAVRFRVVATGEAPLTYQWEFNGGEIPGATDNSLNIPAASPADAGSYRVRVSNALGSVVSEKVTLTVVELSGTEFKIETLTTDNSAVTTDGGLAGPFGSGLAVSDQRLFYTGSFGTARFSIDDLSGAEVLAQRYYSMVSDVQTKKAYALADDANPIGGPDTIATRLLELDSLTGEPIATIPLSAPIPIDINAGLFSGYGRFVLHTGTKVYHILLPDGVVQDLGPMDLLPHVGCENGNFTGIAEFSEGVLSLVYSRDFYTIVRSKVPTGETTDLANLPYTENLCAFTISIDEQRWYFHQSGASPFGSGDLVGFADATFNIAPAPSVPKIRSQPRSLTVADGANAQFSVLARGTDPLTYQWFFGGALLPGETNPTLSLTDVIAAQQGDYHVDITNPLGSISSAVATLTVYEGEFVAVFDDPHFVDSAGFEYSESDTVQASLTHLGHVNFPYVDLNQAIGASQVLLIPNLEISKLSAEIAPETAEALHDYVMNGGLLIIHGTPELLFEDVELLNRVFGLTLASANYGDGYLFRRSAQAAGTRFGSAQLELPTQLSSTVLYQSSLPSQARSIYERDNFSLVTLIPMGQGKIIHLGWDWTFAAPTSYQDGGWLDILHRAVLEANPAEPTPPSIFDPPLGQSVFSQGTARFAVGASGSAPLEFQWFFKGNPLADQTNFSLTLTGVTTNDSGAYSVRVSNALGALTSPTATLQVIDVTNDFHIISLTPDNAHIVSTPEGGGGGLAAGEARLLYSGFSTSRGYQLDDLSGESTLVQHYPVLVSDLHSGRLFSVANGTIPVPSSGGRATRLIELNPLTGALTGGRVDFGTAITIGPNTGYFSGYDRIFILTEGTLYDIEIGARKMYNLGPMRIDNRVTCNDGNFFGVAEYFEGAVHLDYVQDASTIARIRVPDGLVTLVSGFSYLGSTCSFTVSIPRESWYFKNDGFSQFGGTGPTLGQADATFNIPPAPSAPVIRRQPEGLNVVAGFDVQFSVLVKGSQPFTYQWFFEGALIPGATDSTLSLTAVTTANQGSYTVHISNDLGSVTSNPAKLSVYEGNFIAVFDNPSFVDTAGGTFSESDNVQATLAAYGHTVFTYVDLNQAVRGANVILIPELETGDLSSALDAQTVNAMRAFVLGGGLLILNGSHGNFGEDAALLNLLFGYGLSSAYAGSSAPIQPGAVGTQFEGGPGSLPPNNGTVGFNVGSLPPNARNIYSDSVISVVTLFNAGAGKIAYLGYDWFDAAPRGSQNGGWLDVLNRAVLEAGPSTSPPQISTPPQDASVFAGSSVTFSVAAFGASPLSYQWFFRGSPIPGAVSSTLELQNVSKTDAGAYHVSVTNPFGSIVSTPATLTILAAPPNFRIVELRASNARIVDHSEITGDDRGGIALSSTHLYYSGDGFESSPGTGRFSASDLSGGVRLSQGFDCLVSDLATETVYTLGNGLTPLGFGGGEITTLIEIDGATGQLTSRRINLSTSIVTSFDTGIFAGAGQVVIHTGGRVYAILLPSGDVTDYGPVASPPHSGSENWAYWGVAEFFDGATHLVNVGPFDNTIRRTRVPDGTSTILASFINLSDMSSMTVSPKRNRWYFHFESSSQFGGNNESVGYADATFEFDRAPSLSAIPLRFVSEDGTTGPLAFTAVDDVTPGSALVFSVASTNTTVVPLESIVIVPTDDTGTNYSVTVTPVPNLFGNTIVTIYAADQFGNTGSTEFGVGVRSVNDAPSFTAGSDVNVQDNAGPQTIAAWATAISSGPPNESSQTLTFTVANDNSALFSAQPALNNAGTLTFTPIAGHSGSALVTVRLMDNGGTTSGGVNLSAPQTFHINVLPSNRPPTATTANFSGSEDDTVLGQLAGTDPDGDPLVFELVTGPTSGLFTLNPDGHFSYRPPANFVGLSGFSFRVDDGKAESAPAQVTISILSVNDAPSFAQGPDVSVAEDAGAQTIPNWASNISSGPPQESAQIVHFEVSVDNPALFADLPALSPQGALTFRAAANAVGTAAVRVLLRDDGGTQLGGVDASPQIAFTLIVQPVNDAPTFTQGPNVTVAEDAGAQTIPNWASNISPGPAQESSQTLNFEVSADNAALFAVQPALSAQGTLTFRAAADAIGSSSVRLRLLDDGGTLRGGVDASPQVTITVTVQAVNDAPSFTQGPNVTVLEDAGAQTLTGWATNISPGPAQESAQAVHFEVTTDNPALFANLPALDAQGTLAFRAVPDAFGSSTVRVLLRDDGGTLLGGVDASAQVAFTLTVQSVNDAPTFTPGPNMTVAEDAGPTTVPAWARNIRLGPSNESGQVAHFEVVHDNQALFAQAPQVNAQGDLTFTPASNASGSSVVTVVLADNGGIDRGGDFTSETFTFTITVDNRNDVPVAHGQQLSTDEDASLAIRLSGTDMDEDALTYRVTSQPVHGALTGVPPNLVYTPAANYYGNDSFQFGVRDGQSDSAPAQVTITVRSVNDAPVSVIEVSPLADFGASQSAMLILSSNNQDAEVQLDGAGSWDVEGGALSYAWYEAGAPAPFARGALAAYRFGVGLHEVNLITDDGANTGQGTVRFEVITAAQGIDLLILEVNDSTLGRQDKRPLLATLKAAAASCDRGSFGSAANQLSAFQKKVAAQLSKDNPDAAEEFIRMAQVILDALELP